MFIKKDDKVRILTGKDGGKTGKVLQVFPNHGRVSVEGINVMTKHLKKRSEKEAGQQVEFPCPIATSNCQVICPKCQKPTRLGYKRLEDGKKNRQCRKCKETFA